MATIPAEPTGRVPVISVHVVPPFEVYSILPDCAAYIYLSFEESTASAAIEVELQVLILVHDAPWLGDLHTLFKPAKRVSCNLGSTNHCVTHGPVSVIPEVIVDQFAPPSEEPTICPFGFSA